MDKRGFTQVFIYIIILVAAALIIVFGFSSLNDLINLEENVETTKFLQIFQDEIDYLYVLPSGSAKNIELVVPANIQRICFVDHDNEIDYSKIPSSELAKQIDIRQENLFFLSGTKRIPPAFINNLVPLDNPECIPIENGILKARITNIGKKIQINES